MPLVLLLCLGVREAVACLGGDPVRSASQSLRSAPLRRQPLPAPDPLTAFLGPSASSFPYTSSAFSLDAYARSPSDLACAAGEGGCCWGYLEGQAWRRGRAPQPDRRFQSVFGTASPPRPGFLYAASAALLISCPIRCAEAGSTLSLRHWTTAGVRLDVCSLPIDDSGDGLGGEIVDCQPVKRRSSPGPARLHLPPRSEFHIVVRASGFGGSDGGLAMIEDLRADFECGADYYEYSATTDAFDIFEISPPSTRPPESSAADLGAECALLDCDFQSSACGWRDLRADPSAMADQRFVEVAGRFDNPLTGIRRGPDGSAGDRYVASFLRRRFSRAVIGADLLGGGLSDDREIRFEHYEATANILLRGCCDSLGNCPFSSDTQIKASDKGRWKSSSLSCLAGTRRVLFVCEAGGSNDGACGLDDFRLVRGEELLCRQRRRPVGL